MHLLPDTRPYPQTPVNNELLQYARQIAQTTSSAQRQLAHEHLHAQLHQQLSARTPLSLSVAMSMAETPQTYAALMQGLNHVLSAQHSEQVQWFALPAVLVIGAKQATELTTQAPTVPLAACLANHPHLRPLVHAQWLPQLIRAEDFAQITAQQWFNAMQNPHTAAEFSAYLPTTALPIPQDQSVHAVYALGYGDPSIHNALGGALRETALPLMQVWQTHLHSPELTLFVNPLSPNTPLNALIQASHTRLRMALDVFTANAARAIRLQGDEVGVVMAAQENGQILFGFDHLNTTAKTPMQIFTWPLSPHDNIEHIQRDFFDLLHDCHIHSVHQLHQPLGAQDALPSFALAQHHWAGHNPLSSSSHHPS